MGHKTKFKMCLKKKNDIKYLQVFLRANIQSWIIIIESLPEGNDAYKYTLSA